MDSPAARTTSMASMTRESSPPLAIRPMSSGTDESWAAKVIRTSSAPWAAGSREVISKATLALGMDSAASSSLTAAGGGGGCAGRGDDFEGEHDAGELTAAGDPADVVGNRRVVGGEGHPHVVGAVGGGLAGGDLEGHSGLGHGQRGQFLAHGRG